MLCQSILDLGCGKNSPIKNVPKHYSMGVDIYIDYIKLSKQNEIHTQYIVADLLNIDFKRKSFDAIIALDLIEHLAREDAIRLIYKMEEWSKKKVIIFTPNGFLNQDEYDGNPYQIHKSEWFAEDFIRLGYSVKGINGLKILRGEQARIRWNPKWFWLAISDYTQKYVFKHPSFAFQLLAVKEIKP